MELHKGSVPRSAASVDVNGSACIGRSGWRIDIVVDLVVVVVHVAVEVKVILRLVLVAVDVEVAVVDEVEGMKLRGRGVATRTYIPPLLFSLAKFLPSTARALVSISSDM